MHEKKLATMLALTEFATMAFRIDETKGPGKQGHIVADKYFPICSRATFVADTYFDTKSVSDFVQKHFVSTTNVSPFARARKRHEKTMFPQQCFLVCQGLNDIVV